MDCSKTDVFLRELGRMCETSDDCEFCIIGAFAASIGCTFCGDAIRENTKDAINLIQQWSDAHPLPRPKTYADDFFEKFPNATRYCYGETDVPSFCIDNFYALGKRSSCSLKCHGCWNEIYEEGETK